MSGHENTPDTVEPHYTTIVKEHFEAIYFETIEAVYNAPRKKFEQPTFMISSNVQQLLLKPTNGESTKRCMMILCWSMHMMLKQ